MGALSRWGEHSALVRFPQFVRFWCVLAANFDTKPGALQRVGAGLVGNLQTAALIAEGRSHDVSGRRVRLGEDLAGLEEALR